MTIREALLKNESGRIEGIFKKAVRHVLTGEFDRETLKRGLEYFKLWRESRKTIDSDFIETEVVQDYAYEKGVNVFYYAHKDDESCRRHNIAVIEFPPSAKLRSIVVEQKIIDVIKDEREYRSDDTAILSTSLLALVTDSICGIVGPTRESNKMFPNNGFFSKDMGIVEPFGDTNPVGQRRGAIAFKSDGSVSILMEKEKLEARERNFSDFDLVAGTSFYMSSNDTESAIEFLGRPGMSTSNYLIIYHASTGEQAFAEFSAYSLVNRKQIKKLLDQHARKQGWESYVAAETEFNGGGCYFRDDITVLDYSSIDSNPIYHRGWLQWFRRDHYFICKQ